MRVGIVVRGRSRHRGLLLLVLLLVLLLRLHRWRSGPLVVIVMSIDGATRVCDVLRV